MLLDLNIYLLVQLQGIFSEISYIYIKQGCLLKIDEALNYC